MEKIEYKEGVILEEYKTLKNIIEIDASRMRKVKDVASQLKFDGNPLYITARVGGEFKDKALYLPGDYDWVICTDASNVICLIPLKKECE